MQESFLRTSIAQAITTGTIEEGQKYGYISTFEFKLSENLKTHIFENADVDWSHCIAVHRKKTKLWCNGPAYIAELYREELKKSGYQI